MIKPTLNREELALCAALIALCLAAPAAGAGYGVARQEGSVAGEARAAATPRCKTVVRKIRGRNTKVRVCRRPKPKPPAPTPRAGSVVARVTVPDLGEVVYGEGAVWVSGGSVPARTLVRIDPATNAVTATIPVGATHPLGFIAAGEGAVWVSGGLLNAVLRIDPGTNSLAATIPIGPPGGPEGAEYATDDLEVGFGSVWVANHRSGTVSRIDPRTNSVVATITLGLAGPSGPRAIGIGAGSVWVGIPGERSVVRIDPATNAVVGRIPVGGACGYIAVDQAAAWVASGGCRPPGLVRVDPSRNTVATRLDYGGASTSGLVRGVGGVALAFDAVWAVGQGPGRLLRIDPRTSKVTATLPVEQGPGTLAHGAIAVGAGSLWIRESDAVVRLAPNT